MSPTKLRTSGIQGVGLVAVTYVYFLIFAQFAFIHRLDTLGITGAHLKSVMAAMAIGGIVLSLLAPRFTRFPSPARRLQCAFGAAAIAAFLTLAPLNLASAVAVSMLIGAGLGLLTVTLVTHLRQWIGDRNALLKVGLGTGIGYFLCNVPSLFTGAPQVQSIAAALLCLVGIVLANFTFEFPSELLTEKPSASSAIPFPLVVASFAALVWLDSAAFFIIQNTTALKAGTWQGSAHLWANALIHLCAALFSAWLLLRSDLPVVLTAAVGALAFACLLLLDPARALTASVFYPIGVSLYSVALVAYPSLLSPAASSAKRGRQAGWIYAIAGWIGSALGIGMGQNLGHVPPAFVAVAVAVVLAPVILNIFRGRPANSPSPPSYSSLLWSSTALSPPRPLPLLLQPLNAAASSTSPRAAYTATRNMSVPAPPTSSCGVPLKASTRSTNSAPRSLEIVARGRTSRRWASAAPLSGSRCISTIPAKSAEPRSCRLLHFSSAMEEATIWLHISKACMPRKRNSTVPMKNSGIFPPMPLPPPIPQHGPQLYDRYCATCHNANGRTRLKWQSQFIESPAILIAGTQCDPYPPQDRNLRKSITSRRSSNSAFPTQIWQVTSICPTVVLLH